MRKIVVVVVTVLSLVGLPAEVEALPSNCDTGLRSGYGYGYCAANGSYQGSYRSKVSCNNGRGSSETVYGRWKSDGYWSIGWCSPGFQAYRTVLVFP